MLHRRQFLSGLSGTVAAATCGIASASGLSTQKGKASDDTVVARQSEEGVIVHPFSTKLMTGFPPTPENLCAESIYKSSAHRTWAHQHMRELCATQNISRGNAPIVPLPRLCQRG